MKTVEAQYFDGLTSRSHLVDVSFDEYHIKIVNNDAVSINLHRWNRSLTSIEDLFSEQYYSLVNSEYPDQRLDIPISAIDLVFLQSYTHQKSSKTLYHKIANSGIGGLLMMGLLAIGIFAGTYIYGLPAIGELLASQLPIAVEEKLGNEMYQGFEDDYTIDEDKSEQLNQFFKELHFASPYNIKLHVIDDKMVNAFAMPGGNIVVFQGILDSMKSHTELAALLGHELTHINHRHTTKSIFRSLSGYFLFTMIFGDASGIFASIADNTNQLMNMSFSRDLEAEADDTSVKLMKQNGIDVKGMSDLFGRLDDPDIDKNILKFISSHPVTADRIAFAKKERKSQTNIKEHKELEEIFRKLK
jgi:beta-barrel assembly-enhancing protease